MKTWTRHRSGRFPAFLERSRCTWSRWKTVSIARAASVARLDEFIGPKA